MKTMSFISFSRRLSLLLIALLFLIRPAGAHPMPQSAVLLDMHKTGVAVELHLPISEFQLGFGKPMLQDPQGSVARNRPALADYITHHLSATSPDGRSWHVAVKDVSVGPDELPQFYVVPVKYLMAHVWMVPPPGAPIRQFQLHYDVIVHQVVTHVALVSVRQDWDGGVMSGTPEILGEVRWYRTSFAVDRPAGSAWRGFFSVVHLGIQHIAEGTDHLLFLLALLLPASLCAKNRRWGEAAGVRPSVLRLVKIATAFTLGHSLTLAAGAIGWLRAPSQPVEVLIALSIFVSAIHALRPIFPGREMYVAAGFGLIHGLSFASVVAEFHLDAWHTTLSILGFNIGIELMQIFVLLVTMPWLLLLARTPAYPPFRVVAATASGIAALGWMAERALGWPNPIGFWVERVAAHAVFVVIGLALLSAGAYAWNTLQRRNLPIRTLMPNH